MDASRLDRRVTLSRRSTVTSAKGERSYTWAPYATVWATKIESGAREYQAGQTLLSESTFTFIIRWRADVTGTDQVIFEGTAYNIGSVSEIGRHEGLSLLASGVVC